MACDVFLRVTLLTIRYALLRLITPSPSSAEPKSQIALGRGIGGTLMTEVTK